MTTLKSLNNFKALTLNHEVTLYGSTKIQVFLLLSKFALIRQVGIFNQKKVFFGLMIIIYVSKFNFNHSFGTVNYF